MGANEEIGAAFKYLLDKSVHKLFHSEDYRTPKEVLALSGVEGVKIYVLGPPKDVGAGAEQVKLADLYSARSFTRWGTAAAETLL